MYADYVVNTLTLQVPELQLTKEELPDEGAEVEEFLSSFSNLHENLPTELEHLLTPRRYMALLHTYKAIHEKHKNNLTTKTKHLQVRCSSQEVWSIYVWSAARWWSKIRLLNFTRDRYGRLL